VGTVILGQVPDPDTTTAVTADYLSLIRVNDHIVDSTSMAVAALNCATAGFPDLDSAVLGARNHPFSFTMEGYARNVVGVTFEGQERIRIRGFDIVELDRMVAGSCKKTLVWRNAQAVNLRVRVLYGPRADA